MSKRFDVETDMTIQNVVGSGELPVEVDIDALAEAFEEVFGYKHFESREAAEEYSGHKGYTWVDDGSQPGLYYEAHGDDGPQVTFHRSGSYIVRADSEEKLYETNEMIIDELHEIGVVGEKFSAEELEFNIKNVVALAILDEDIRLRILKRGLQNNLETNNGDTGSDASYEPEQFPALEYEMGNYPCSFLVYGNGKVIVAGANSIEVTKESMSAFYDEMDEAYFKLVR